ncbi:MAG: MBL fold metallo-hydrolase, partial [Leptospiraceae bacterium]|nr:MBL fold metallo-hydrolase [Leptospiraceae bacterium]
MSVCAAILVLHCSSLDPERESSPWYYDGRYHNLDNDDAITQKSLWSVLYWKLWGPADPPDAIDMQAAARPAAVIQRQTNDFLAPTGRMRLVWMGHATVWIAAEHQGRRTHIITDPNFFAVPLRSRLTSLPIAVENLPPVDAALISHAHLDHLNADSLRLLQSLNPAMRIYLPHGMRAWARSAGLSNVVIQDWWDQNTAGLLQVTFQPAHHWSRMALNDTMQF